VAVLGTLAANGCSVADEPTGTPRGAALPSLAAASGGRISASSTRVGLALCGLAFVLCRTVAFVVGCLVAAVRFAAAALPVTPLALIGCFAGRFATATLLVVFFGLLLALSGWLAGRLATAALPVFLSTLATRLSGRLAEVARTCFFGLVAAFVIAGFNFADFAGRLAAVARPDDFDALLLFETVRAIAPSPGERRRRQRRRSS